MVRRGRPRIRPSDRVFWVALRRVWSRWAEVLAIVKPETVVRWHRAGYRLFWRELTAKSSWRRWEVKPCSDGCLR